MSFFWECNDEDLLLLGLLGRRGVLRQLSGHAIRSKQCERDSRRINAPRTKKQNQRTDRLPEDVFQRVASFLAPLPNHPAHAGALAMEPVLPVSVLGITWRSIYLSIYLAIYIYIYMYITIPMLVRTAAQAGFVGAEFLLGTREMDVWMCFGSHE